MYGTLQVLGPEHEFSVVDEKLQPMPIVDRVIKEVHGRIVNNVDFGDFSFGKELQAHVAEFKGSTPFSSPLVFEETITEAVEEYKDGVWFTDLAPVTDSNLITKSITEVFEYQGGTSQVDNLIH
jgi:tetrahydromethanopterin S-methyltransferase subunit A